MTGDEGATETVRHEDWAPCLHTEEERRHAETWLKSILDRPSDEFYPGAFDEFGAGCDIERLILEINHLGGEVTCLSDQWVLSTRLAVSGDTLVETRIYGDTFLLALAENVSVVARVRRPGGRTA